MGIFSEGSLPGQCAAFRRKDLGVASKLSCIEMIVTIGKARSRSAGGSVGEAVDIGNRAGKLRMQAAMFTTMYTQQKRDPCEVRTAFLSTASFFKFRKTNFA